MSTPCFSINGSRSAVACLAEGAGGRGPIPTFSKQLLQLPVPPWPLHLGFSDVSPRKQHAVLFNGGAAPYTTNPAQLKPPVRQTCLQAAICSVAVQLRGRSGHLGTPSLPVPHGS